VYVEYDSIEKKWRPFNHIHIQSCDFVSRLTLSVTCRVLASQYAVRLTLLCTPGTGVNLWGESPL
jgi:hypothetical protein